jgi:hypothetical protein
MATSRGLRTTSAVWLPHTLSARAVLVLGAALDERLLLALFGGLVLLAMVVIQVAELSLPLSSDQALYSFIGRAIHQGAVPYRDLTDLKPPGIFYLRAALDVLAPVSWTSACVASPLPASCGWMVVKLADLLTTLLFAAGLFAAARTMQFERGAAFVSAALGALSANLPGAAARRARLLAELKALPPAAIALSPEAERAGDGLDLDGFPALAQLLARAYTPVAEVASDPKYGGWRLYVRRGAG